MLEISSIENYYRRHQSIHFPFGVKLLKDPAVSSDKSLGASEHTNCTKIWIHGNSGQLFVRLE